MNSAAPYYSNFNSTPPPHTPFIFSKGFTAAAQHIFNFSTRLELCMKHLLCKTPPLQPRHSVTQHLRQAVLAQKAVLYATLAAGLRLRVVISLHVRPAG